LKSTLHGAGDGAFAVAADGTITAWNPAAERLLGYPEDEAVGRRCWEVIDGQDECGTRICNADCHVRGLVGRGEPVRSFEARVRTKTGRPVWVDMSVVAVRELGDAAPYAVHLVRDTTATRELLARLQERAGAVPPDAAPPSAPSPDLSPREREILGLLIQGLNTARIAGQLRVSGATVRNHVQRIFAKLGVHSRLEAVAHATRHRLL
jgi:PAS domain S-box-containing protein